MKKIPILLFLLLLLGGCVVRGQTHIYNHYATHSNLEVAYLKDFPLDSVQRVNVTILQAKNNRAWRWLKKEFNIDDISQRGKAVARSGGNVINLSSRDKQDPRKDAKVGCIDHYILSTSYTLQTLIFYHITTRDELRAVFSYSIKNLK